MFGKWTLTCALAVVALLPNCGHAQSRCEPVQVAMCKGLVNYNMTRLPNKFGHKSQAEVYWALQPYWPFMDAGCSDNLRLFLCGLYLPKCTDAARAPLYPCAETCQKAKVRCRKQMRDQKMTWDFRCKGMQPKSTRQCIRPVRENKKRKYRQYVLCEKNKLPLCMGVPFTQGSLPNMFLQGDARMLEREMTQFAPLLASGCSKKLRFFMCGTFMPYCVPGSTEVTGRGSSHAVVQMPDVPFVVPCRELCQEVYDQCSGEYSQRTGGLPWPGKFHCHRFPSLSSQYNRSSGHQEGHSVIPCTMPPYNYRGN